MKTLKSYSDFKGIHAGEEVIIAGNGLGLANIPVEFLNSRPSFALNYGSWYRDTLADGSPSPLRGWKPTYWHGLDEICFQAIEKMPDGSSAFIPRNKELAHEYKRYIGRDNVFGYKLHDRVEWDDGEVYWVDEQKTYVSSLFTACHIAKDMDFDQILLVGFDCTWVNDGTKRAADWDDTPGVNFIPHWYNGSAVEQETPIVLHKGYNKHAAIIRRFFEGLGKEVVNLSNPTMCTTLPKASVSQYMS